MEFTAVDDRGISSRVWRCPHSDCGLPRLPRNPEDGIITTVAEERNGIAQRGIIIYINKYIYLFMLCKTWKLV